MEKLLSSSCDIPTTFQISLSYTLFSVISWKVNNTYTHFCFFTRKRVCKHILGQELNIQRASLTFYCSKRSCGHNCIVSFVNLIGLIVFFSLIMRLQGLTVLQYLTVPCLLTTFFRNLVSRMKVRLGHPEGQEWGGRQPQEDRQEEEPVHLFCVLVHAWSN